jgi:hypothetical protein
MDETGFEGPSIKVQSGCVKVNEVLESQGHYRKWNLKERLIKGIVQLCKRKGKIQTIAKIIRLPYVIHSLDTAWLLACWTVLK